MRIQGSGVRRRSPAIEGRVTSGSSAERGSAVIELVLSLPALVLIMMWILGIGWVLSTKQHAVVAARYSASAADLSGANPDGDHISQAVSKGVDKTWATVGVDPPDVSDSSKAKDALDDVGGIHNLDGASGFLSGFVNDVLMDPLMDAFTGILDKLGAGGVKGVEARGKPEHGLLARWTHLPDAQARYYRTSGTWTCADGADYAKVVKGGTQDALDKVPVLGGILKHLADPLPDSLTCCDRW